MIRVLSFNLRCSTADDGRNGWPFRKELAIGRIRHFDPDLLGLQECVYGEQADYVEAQLPDYGFFALQRGNPERPDAEMAPILYKRSNFEAVDSGCFWLSETPHVAGSMSWNSACTRITMWMRLRSKQRPDQTLIFVNTHLDYRATAAYEGAKVLRQQLDALDAEDPLIVTGDFNAEKETPAYRTLLDGNEINAPEMDRGRLYDTFRAVNDVGVDEGTFHNYGRQHPTPAIDWILASEQFSTLEAGIDRYHQGERYPSDHYPAVAMLRLRGR